MTTSLWLSYVAAVILLMCTPGPSQLLMLSHTLASGFPRTVSTAAGDLTANALQMLTVCMGVGAIARMGEGAFLLLQLLGVVYLGLLGLRKIWGNDVHPPETVGHASLLGLWLQGFITSAANPKALVFFTALFPQFIVPDAGIWAQFSILCTTYLAIDGLFLTAYGGAASWLADRLRRSRGRADRIAGVLLVLAAILLLARVMF